MPKLKDILPEGVQRQLGQIRTDKDDPPFAKNEVEWKKQWNKLNEAPMDKRFQNDWEKSCRALINHLDNEIKKGRGEIGQTNLSMLKKMQSHVKEAIQIPSKMGKILGYE